MALVQESFWLNIEMRDSGNNVTSKTFQMTAATAANALTDAAAIIPLWKAITDAEVLSYSVSGRFVEDAPVIPAAGVHIENLAEVIVQLEGYATKKATLTIPAPKAGIFTGVTGDNSNVVDTADGDLVAFVAQFTTIGDNTLLISDGEHADGIVRGRRVHRKSRRG